MAGGRPGALARSSELIQAHVPTMLLPDCSHSALPTLLSVVPSHRFIASLSLLSVPVQPLQGHRAGWPQVPFTGESATGTDSLEGHREGLEHFPGTAGSLAGRQTQLKGSSDRTAGAGHSHCAHGLRGRRSKEQNVPLLYLYSSVLWWVGD